MISANLIYCLSKVWPSGMTSFTVHLYHALESVGYVPTIIRPSKKKEIRKVEFGGYGVHCLEVPWQECLPMVAQAPSIIVAGNRPEKLPDKDLMFRFLREGAHYVLHDLTQFAELGCKLRQAPILIREVMKEKFKNGIYIPHPYVWQTVKTPKKRKNAVCTSRLATAKRPRLILRANRYLPKKYRVEMRGSQHRLVAYGLSQTYKDVWTPSFKECGFPQTLAAPVEVCAGYRYHVDMTYFPDDGGGTQYAQMEAINAGCTPVMHEDWFRHPGKHWMKNAVVTIASPKELADELQCDIDRSARIATAQKNLNTFHDPFVVGQLWKEIL